MPDSPRGYYPLARIVKLYYGKDGCARSALVKTATSEVTWPTVKVAPVLPSSGGGILQRKYKTEYKCILNKTRWPSGLRKKLDMVAVSSHDVGLSPPPAHVLIN